MPSHVPRPRSFERKLNMEEKVEQKPPRIKVNVNVTPEMELDMSGLNKHSHMLVSPTSTSKKSSSNGRMNCLCSPTTHVGSFRCRHHRSSGMHRARSVGSNLAELGSKAGAISDSLNAQ